jgi:lambda family phage portal protein
MLQWARNLLGLGRSAAPTPARPKINARYDNATSTNENSRHWLGVDYLSPKAANSFQVRKTLRMRSRYEVSNNPFLFGICHSNADDLIDTGPTLQVYTRGAAYNRAVEASWQQWCAEVGLVEKLRTCKLAKSVDGEGFLVLKTVEDLEHPVKLYPCDVEADQVTTVQPRDVGELWLDGLVLHPVTGQPVEYSVLKHHPGDFFFPDMNPFKAEWVKARYVVHWFQKTRPGQVRGVPAFTPSLDLFTELRAFRKATLGAAEIAAEYAAVLQQDREMGAGADPDEDDSEYAPFERIPTARRMMTMLPPGVTLSQLKAENPSTTYEMFQTLCLAEACRPLAYPLNLALGTSQRFNFSSAKLDHISYRNALHVERDQCARVVLERVFRAWHEEAVLSGAIPAGDGLTAPAHEWHWPGFEPIDPLSDAQTDAQRIAAGTLTLQEFWARRGQDWRDVLAQLKAEKELLDEYGLAYGDVVTRSVSQTEQTDPEAANAA